MKKRRELRILAAIMAAGCVWVGGMNDAWAAESALIDAYEYNYIAVAGSYNVNPFGNDDEIKVSNGERYVNVDINGTTYKYIYTIVDKDGVFDNNSNDDVGYWIRDGFGVKAITERYHPAATDVRLDLYKVPGTNANYDYISMSGAHVAEPSTITTANNGEALDNFTYIQYAAITNSGGINTPSEWEYYVMQNNSYVNVGGNNFSKNFYEFKATEFNATTGKYTFKGQDVEYENVYRVGNKIGVFLTKAANNASTARSSYDINAEVYGGAVFGKNNEILLSGYDAKTNTWSTVWAGEVTDPYATVESMTLSEFNEILHHLHEENVKLANADIVGIKAGGNENSGTLKLINKANNLSNGLTISSVGGSDGNDTRLVFTANGNYVDDEGATQSYNNSFSLDTGSKVVANNGQAYTTNQKLEKLTINGNTYLVSGSTSGGTTTVSNITLTAGNNISISGITDNGTTNYTVTAHDTDTTYEIVGSAPDGNGRTQYTLKDASGNGKGIFFDTNTDTNTLYAVSDGVYNSSNGETSYTFSGDNGFNKNIIDKNNYVTNATIQNGNLVLERIGMNDITVPLSGIGNGASATDFKLISNPNGGTYTVASNGDVTLKVSDGTNTSDVVISGLASKSDVDAAKTEVVGNNDVIVTSRTGSKGQTIYTVSVNDDNTTYEVEKITASSNLVGGQKAKYQIKDKVTGDIIGTIIDHDATLTNLPAVKTTSNDGIINTYKITDTAGNYTTIDDVASATKLQNVVSDVTNILNGDVLSLGVDSTSANEGITLLNNIGSATSKVNIAGNVGSDGNDATLTFSNGQQSFSISVGSTVIPNADANKVINGLSINDIDYVVKDTTLDSSRSGVKSTLKTSDGLEYGKDYIIYDTSGRYVVVDDIASAEYVKDAVVHVYETIDDKRTRVEQGNNVIVTNSTGTDGELIYTINATDTTYSVIKNKVNLLPGEKTQYIIKNNITNATETIIDTDTTYEVEEITASSNLAGGQKAKYQIKDKVTGNIVGTIIDHDATLTNLPAEKISSNDGITNTYKITDTAGYYTTIVDVASAAKLQSVINDISNINNTISGASGSLTVSTVVDDINTDKKEIGNINLLQGNQVRSSIGISSSGGTDKKDVVVTFEKDNHSIDIITGSKVVPTADNENYLHQLEINGHTYNLLTVDGVATNNNIVISEGELYQNGMHGWQIVDLVKQPDVIFRDTTLDEVTSIAAKKSLDYGYKYTIYDTAGKKVELDDVASASKLSEVSGIASANDEKITKILDGTAVKLGVDDTNESIALLKEDNIALSTVKVIGSITDDANDATLTFSDENNKQFSVKVGSTVRVSADNNNVLNGLTVNGTPYTIKDTMLDSAKSHSEASEIRNTSGEKIGNNYVVWDTSQNKVQISDVASASYVDELTNLVNSKTSRDVFVVQQDSNIEVTHDINSTDVTYNLKLAKNVDIVESLEVGDKIDIYGATGQVLANTIKANESVEVGDINIKPSEIIGLSNREWHAGGNYNSGRAATEEQLQKAIELVQSGSVAGDKYVASGEANASNKAGKIILSVHNGADVEIDGLEDYTLGRQNVNVDDNGTVTLSVADRYNSNNYYGVTINGIAKASDVGDIRTISISGTGSVNNPTTIVHHINNLYGQVNTISANNSDWSLVGEFTSNDSANGYVYNSEYTVGDGNKLVLNVQDKSKAGSAAEQVVVNNVAKASDIGDVRQINSSLAEGTVNNVVNHINNIYSEINDMNQSNSDWRLVGTAVSTNGQTSYTGDYEVENGAVTLNVQNQMTGEVETITIKDVAKASDIGDMTTIANNLANNVDNNVVNHLSNLYQKVATEVAKDVIVESVDGNIRVSTSQNNEGDTTYGLSLAADVKISNSITVGANSGSGSNIVLDGTNASISSHSVTADVIEAKQHFDVGDVRINSAEIIGLDNTDWDSSVTYTGGKAATQEQLQVVDGKVIAVEDKVDKNTATLEEHTTEIANLYSNDQILSRTIGYSNQYLDSRINQVNSRVNKVGAGAAALAALHPMDFDPDDKLSFSAGVGNYAGENATALGMFYRPTEKVMMSVGGTYGNGENMVNMGVTFALDKTNNISNSRTAMAKEIVALRDHVAKQDAQIAQLMAMVNSLVGNKAANEHVKAQMFPDVPENHWAYEYVRGLVDRGVIEGYPEGFFGGDRMMTRYEFAAALFRAMENGEQLTEAIYREFEPELGRIRVDRIKGADDDLDKIERVRVNTAANRDDYGSETVKH